MWKSRRWTPSKGWRAIGGQQTETGVYAGPSCAAPYGSMLAPDALHANQQRSPRRALVSSAGDTAERVDLTVNYDGCGHLLEMKRALTTKELKKERRRQRVRERLEDAAQAAADSEREELEDEKQKTSKEKKKIKDKLRRERRKLRREEARTQAA